MNEPLIQSLFEIGAVKFGQFQLKSGIVSPFYLDLRVLVSYPRVLHQAAQAFAGVLAGLSFDRIAAIPYAALPIGTAIALEMERPLIYPRREKKEYGTGRVIEGEFKPAEVAVVIDDVITTGASKLEAIEPLLTAGLIVHDIVVLVDREQSGSADLAQRGYRVHAVLKVTEMMRTLKETSKISAEQYADVLAFLERGSHV